MNIKKIIQNKQYQFLACVIVAVILMLLMSFNKTETKRMTFISKDVYKINERIALFTKYGYEIEVLFGQPIAATNEYYGGSHYYERHTIYKGDILYTINIAN